MSWKPGDKEGKRNNHPPDPNKNPGLTKGGKESAGDKSKRDTSNNPSRDSNYNIEFSQQEQNRQEVSEISSSKNKTSEEEPDGNSQPSKLL